jgi:lipid II:glycine glycyltransferase (peptidoglycan interpeptide bridge formation enzyme)
MLTAAEAGTPIAFMLILLHGDTATYHIGWTGPRGRAVGAHNLLLWDASCTLAARGYIRLDLGRTDPLRTPGIARFKLGAGAAPRDLGPTRLRI